MNSDPYLTAYDRKLLDYLTEGLTSPEIAVRVGKPHNAVRVAVARVINKVGAVNRTAAAVWWVRQTEVRGA